MFDARLRPLIDPPLKAIAQVLAERGISANGLTLSGLVAGLAASAAIAAGWMWAGLGLFAASRLADGLDGSVARLATPTDRGGFIDIVADFAIYAAIPLAFAVADPAANGLPAAALLASFIVSGITFMAFAVFAASRNLTSNTQGQKSIYYLAGLAEGFETIVVFALMCVWPGRFAVIAYIFAGVCLISASGRVANAWRMLD